MDNQPRSTARSTLQVLSLDVAESRGAHRLARGRDKLDSLLARLSASNDHDELLRTLASLRTPDFLPIPTPGATVDEQLAGPAMIEAVGLSKYYGDFAAIEDVSFQHSQGAGGGLSGPQRRRQKHHDEAADRLPGPLGRRRPGSPATTWPSTGWPARPGWAICPKTARCIPT